MELTKEQNEALIALDVRNAMYGVLDKIRDPRIVKARPKTTAPRKMLITDFVRLPKEGGVQTFFENVPYPMFGFPMEVVIDKVDVVKSTFIAVMGGFVKMFKKQKVKSLIFLLFFRKQFFDSFLSTILAMERLLLDFKMDARFYAPAVLEIHNAFSSISKDEVEPGTFLLVGNMRTLVCTILQYDDSYRYRLQHVLGLMDRRSYRLNPIAELERVIRIGLKCENDERIKQTWKGALLGLKIIRFLPAKKHVIKIFRNIDPDRVQLRAGDYYFTYDKAGYDWSFGIPPELIEEVEKARGGRETGQSAA